MSGPVYNKPFFITEPVSNNAFSYSERVNKKLFVPGLIEGGLNEVKVGRELVFEDFDDDGVLRSCVGLEYFVKTAVAGTHVGEGYGSGAPAYIFDNHNHAFAFWHLEAINGVLSAGALLIHVDQHKDTRKPPTFLSARDAYDPEKVFQYTNTVLNVGNFILAAQKTGLVSDIIFIDSEQSLSDFDFACLEGRQLILDIDLDFFAPELDYIGNDKKLNLIRNLLQHAKVVTFATSPFFIDQSLAIFWLKQISQP